MAHIFERLAGICVIDPAEIRLVEQKILRAPRSARRVDFDFEISFNLSVVLSATGFNVKHRTGRTAVSWTHEPLIHEFCSAYDCEESCVEGEYAWLLKNGKKFCSTECSLRTSL